MGRLGVWGKSLWGYGAWWTRKVGAPVGSLGALCGLRFCGGGAPGAVAFRRRACGRSEVCCSLRGQLWGNPLGSKLFASKFFVSNFFGDSFFVAKSLFTRGLVTKAGATVLWGRALVRVGSAPAPMERGRGVWDEMPVSGREGCGGRVGLGLFRSFGLGVECGEVLEPNWFT